MKNYQDIELDGVQKGLRSAGFSISICGKEKGKTCTGKMGGSIQTDIAFKDVQVKDFDRMAIIGGPGAKELTQDQECLDLVKRFTEAKKLVGAICIAPTVLAAAGVLEGKKATVFDSKEHEQSKYLTQNGVKFVDEAVVVDLPFVTANGPDVAENFGKIFATTELGA